MAYSKTTWQNNVTDIDETNLNKIEQGIYDNSLVVDAVANTLNPTDTETYKTAELTEGQITDVIGVSDIVIKGQTEQDGTPTPSAPVDVNVVSGSNVVNTSNKNLWNLKNDTYSIGGITAIVKNGKITLNGTATSNAFIEVILNSIVSWKEGEDYTISVFNSTSNNNIKIRTNDSGTDDVVLNVNNTSTIISYSSSTTRYNNKITIRVQNGTTLNNFILKPMLEQGSTATAYELHQGKELTLDLGSIELCKIGNYQDYFYKSGSKWYLHKEIGKVVLNGTEEWGQEQQSGFYRYFININAINNSSLANNILIYSSHFKGIAFNNRNSDTNNTIYTLSNGQSSNRIFLNVTNITSLANFKTWLASNNVIAYYVLITATDTEITDTNLIPQLEAIYNAPLYEQTNITQENNDLPMVLDITACKDNINGIKAFIRK